MCLIIVFIKENFKDIFNVLFWLFTGILAFLTYKNAKKTLFNPIRSETVKYQMKIITEFIDKHAKEIYDIDNIIDYPNLIKLNFDTHYILNISKDNFEENDYNKSILKFCEDNLGGAFELRNINNEMFLQKTLGDFDELKLYLETENIKNKEIKYNHLHPQRIYITKNFYSFYEDLISIKDNPFTPLELQKVLEVFYSNINYNININYKLLNKYLNSSEDKKYQEVYNEFASLKRDHKIDIKLIRESITEFFKVNK